MSDEGHFNGRVGVIVEVAPNTFYQYVVKEAEIQITVDREVFSAFDALAPMMLGPSYLDMHLTGRLISSDEASQRPAWAAEPAAEIEGARAIGDGR